METTTQAPAFKTFNQPNRVTFGGILGGVFLNLPAAVLGGIVLALIGAHVDSVNHPGEFMSGIDGFFLGGLVGAVLASLLVTTIASLYSKKSTTYGSLATTVTLCAPLVIWIATGDFFTTLETINTYSTDSAFSF